MVTLIREQKKTIGLLSVRYEYSLLDFISAASLRARSQRVPCSGLRSSAAEDFWGLPIEGNTGVGVPEAWAKRVGCRGV